MLKDSTLLERDYKTVGDLAIVNASFGFGYFVVVIYCYSLYFFRCISCIEIINQKGAIMDFFQADINVRK